MEYFKKNTLLIIFILFFFHINLHPQSLNIHEYSNPILHADFSDPDIIRFNDCYYLIASSFNCMPGIPVLKSYDLINWTLVNYVYRKLPFEKYNKPAHGEGSWAPSIRYHNKKFYVYFCTPQEGLFVATSKHPEKKWKLKHIVNVALWEDPCPFWDDDGNAYLIRSKVCGNELYLHRMSEDGMKILDNGVLIYKDSINPIIEGPKLYKLNGYYYIFAPAGGVPTGWQEVLRSKNIYGPYETKRVLHQGNTNINGPHQGGLVQAIDSSWWFIHFQSKDCYGRIVHLQPVKWINDWPLMGTGIENPEKIGEPVYKFSKPFSTIKKDFTLQTSDEFNSKKLGLQWQWHANPQKNWYSLKQNKGHLRLYSINNYSQNGNLWLVPNLLLQKFPALNFTVTTKIIVNFRHKGELGGLVISGNEWAFLGIEKIDLEKYKISMFTGKYHQCGDLTICHDSDTLFTNTIFLRVKVNENCTCEFSYSIDNENFIPIGVPFEAKPGRWIGSKVGLFSINREISDYKNGYIDIDWFKIE